MLVCGSAFAGPSSPARPIDDRSGFVNVSPYVGGFIFEDDQDLNNAAIYGIAFGYNYMKDFSTEFRFGFIDTKNTEESFRGDRLNNRVGGYLFTLEEQYHFRPGHRFQPYIAGGLGAVVYDPRHGHDDTLGLFEYGVGAEYFISDSWSLRADVRHILPFDTSNNNVMFSGGLTVYLGKPAAPAPVPPCTKEVSYKKCSPSGPTTATKTIACDEQAPSDERCVKCPDTDTWVANLSDCPKKMKDCPCPDGSVTKVEADKDCPPCATPPEHKEKCKKDVKVCVDNKVVVKTVEYPCDGPEPKDDTCGRTCIKFEVQFIIDTTKPANKAEFNKEIATVAKFLKENPNVHGTIEGGTCWLASYEHNYKLSERRAEFVKKTLTSKKYGIDKARLDTVWFGETRPEYDNYTETGMEKNRRAFRVLCSDTAEMDQHRCVVLKVKFDKGMADVKAADKSKVKKVAEAIKSLKDGVKAKVEVYNDGNVKEGSTKAAPEDIQSMVKALSQKRADSLKAYMVDKCGVPSDKVEASGYAEFRPTDMNQPNEDPVDQYVVHVYTTEKVGDAKAAKPAKAHKKHKAAKKAEAVKAPAEAAPVPAEEHK